MRGLGELVRICRTYGASSQALPTSSAEQGTYLNGAAMLFESYFGPPSTAGGSSAPSVQRRYARFPVLPVRPAVPAQLNGWLLSGPSLRRPAPTRALNAVVQFALWMWRAAGKDPGSAPSPPVLADAPIQRGFWNAPPQMKSGADALGDFANYAYVEQDYPPTFADTTGIIYDALSPAVAGTTDLASALAAATRSLNAAAAQYQTDKAMRSQANAEKAAAYGQFGASASQPAAPAGPVVRVCRK